MTNYKPLKVWIYNKGFGRFCNELYTTDVAEIENMFVHLTNVAIQQYSDKYSQKHGGKFSIESLKLYVESAYGTEALQKMMDDIHNIILTSLRVKVKLISVRSVSDHKRQALLRDVRVRHPVGREPEAVADRDQREPVAFDNDSSG